jgi:hypothetical protein
MVSSGQWGYGIFLPVNSDAEKPVSFSRAGFTYLIDVSGLITLIGLGEWASRLELNSSLSCSFSSAC